MWIRYNEGGVLLSINTDQCTRIALEKTVIQFRGQPIIDEENDMDLSYIDILEFSDADIARGAFPQIFSSIELGVKVFNVEGNLYMEEKLQPSIYN